MRATYHSLFLEILKYSEELAYPGIFLGQKRPDNDSRITPVHYSEICKSELRRSDRRAAMCVENIFFKTKKLQMKILLGKSQVCKTASVVLRDMLALKAWLRKVKNDFTQHSQLHRRKITMPTTFNGHLFFLCSFDKLTL